MTPATIAKQICDGTRQRMTADIDELRRHGFSGLADELDVLARHWDTIVAGHERRVAKHQQEGTSCAP